MLIDSHAYTTYQCECIWINDPTDEYYLALSTDLALMSAKNYDLILFFPTYWAPKDDGTRSVDITYQYCISDIVEDFLDKYQIPHLIVPDQPIEERVEWVTSLVYRANRFNVI